MPADGLAWLPRHDVLTDAEVIRLVRIAVQLLGVRSVRFTGGEPLLRPGLASIVAACAALDPRPDLALTTNGIGLDSVASALATAGLDRINVSLDTLDPQRFLRITRRDRHPAVLRGLEAAAAAGLNPVKLNAVLLKGINDDEAPALVRFAVAHHYQLRFIEQMPLDGDDAWRRENMVTAEEILGMLEKEFELSPVSTARGSAPAETWLLDGGPNTVGVIASVTRPFCRACARTRLTADGQIRNCLFSTSETDLRALLRSGADDATLALRWQHAMWGKGPGHGIGTSRFEPASRSMSAIGG